MLNILLIDDDLLEKEILENALNQHLAHQEFSLRHAFKSSEAIGYLLKDKFDLVLLDNMLAASISGKFSVPILQQYLKNTPLVIISNDITVDYLSHPVILGVETIVDKKNLDEFLRAFVSSIARKNKAKPSDLTSPLQSSVTAA